MRKNPPPVYKSEVFVMGNGDAKVCDASGEKRWSSEMVAPAGLNKIRPSEVFNGDCVKQSEGSDEGAAGEHLGDYYHDKLGRLRKAKGLHWILAALFAVADMAGGGIVALPTAIVRSQFIPGMCIMLVMAVMATYSAVMLGRSWNILLRRFPQYRTHCRKPYAEMGYRAMGPRMRTFVSVCLNITQFGASTVFLLLSGKNIQDFLYAFTGTNVSFCIIILVIALCLWPVTLLKSPQDFWFVIVLGMLSTAAAVVLICIGASIDSPTCGPARELPRFNIVNYLLSLGTILFTYGGHTAFPTIQHDMRRPKDFTKSAILAFIIITIFNVTAVTFGGMVYGNALRDSVINSIQTSWIQQSVNLMITAHCLLTVTLIINPLNQEVEEALEIPQHFGWKRVAARSAVLAAVVFVAESVPSFGPVLDLIGGSTVTLTSEVFPVLFCLYLAAGEKIEREAGPGQKKSCSEGITFSEMVERTDKATLIWGGFIIVFCSIAGLVATIFAAKAMATTHFTMPCYVSPFIEPPQAPGAVSSTNCCGPFQNIKVFNQTVCNEPKFDFY